MSINLTKTTKFILNKIKILFYVLIGKKYLRQGQCNCCGNCCKNISIKHGKQVILTLEQFEALQRKFHVYRMFKVMDNTQRGLVFQCVFLEPDTGKCVNYKNRPPICRNYPNEVIFKIGGCLSDQCGFTFKPIIPFKSVYDKIKSNNKRHKDFTTNLLNLR